MVSSFVKVYFAGKLCFWGNTGIKKNCFLKKKSLQKEITTDNMPPER